MTNPYPEQGQPYQPPQAAPGQPFPGQYPGQYPGQPGYAAAPRPPRRLLPPMGVDDWARDIAAAFLLLISLALPWTYGDGGISVAATRVDVLLITILTVLGVGVTFLVRAGALGTLSIQAVLGIRLAFAAPYGILALVYLILSGFGIVSGIGFAAGIGLAGTALIAQPRRAELAADPGVVPFAARIARVLVAVVAGAVALTTLIGVVIAAIQLSQYGAFSPILIIEVILLLLAMGGALLAILVAVLRRSASGRIVGWGVSVAILPIVLISALSNWALTGIGFETLAGGTLVLWLSLLAGVLCSPGVAATSTPLPALQLWFRVARDALTAAAVAAGALGLIFLLTVFVPYASIGFPITLVVASAAAAVAAIVARTRLLADPAGSRLVVLGLAGVVGGLGLVAFVVAIVSTLGSSLHAVGSSAYLFAIALIAPAVTAIVALTVPAEVRAYARANAPAAPAHPGYPGYPAQQPGYPAAPAQAPAPAPAPAPPQYAAAPAAAPITPAADPATPAAELAQLALDPANWVALAGNPASYPDLVTYLREHGDAAVQQALQNRAG